MAAKYLDDAQWAIEIYLRSYYGNSPAFSDAFATEFDDVDTSKPRQHGVVFDDGSELILNDGELEVQEETAEWTRQNGAD